jgi:hypothetical protein
VLGRVGCSFQSPLNILGDILGQAVDLVAREAFVGQLQRRRDRLEQRRVLWEADRVRPTRQAPRPAPLHDQPLVDDDLEALEPVGVQASHGCTSAQRSVLQVEQDVAGQARSLLDERGGPPGERLVAGLHDKVDARCAAV